MATKPESNRDLHSEHSTKSVLRMRYGSHVVGMGISKDDQENFLESIWTIMQTFVDLAFNMNSKEPCTHHIINQDGSLKDFIFDSMVRCDHPKFKSSQTNHEGKHYGREWSRYDAEK